MTENSSAEHPKDEEGIPILSEKQDYNDKHALKLQSGLQKLWHNSIFRTAVRNASLILTWYFFSTCISLWNRKLLGKGHGVLGKGPFPAPMLMSSLQFAAQIVMAKFVLYLGVAERKHPDKLSWHQYFLQVVPNGTATGLDIGLSNFSLSLITLSFYTMCKSTTPVFLLFFCFAWGLERPSASLGVVIAIICVGLILLVYGEAEFNLAGFIIVMTASALSGLRWTITQVLLQGSSAHGVGSSGGPVEVLLSLTPVMSVTVAIMSMAFERLWVVIPGSPYFDSLQSLGVTALIMLCGGTIAFFMVWTEFAVIASTSALTFMIAGTFKELVTVLAAVLFLGEHLTYVNCIGLVVLVLGVALFNYTKYRKVIMGQVVSARAPTDHEKGGARAERHEAHDGERAFLVGGRRMNLGSPRASPRAGKPPSLSADLELITQRPSAQHNGLTSGPGSTLALGKSQSSS
ncbi:hypothetical protein CVIRNUC_005201 [Coccomyxa viridis]|uniref:Sugar phosphate transporter domain-containing protein n=1 Tax=Coccomyxa viridis TaxID=1274662 RepID=A0AAV1I862_9CHLO|nr:hypothetical protein CVIRNUC_005201 [Coccomyxa viridis]